MTQLEPELSNQEYRGYFLRISFAQRQWRVDISMIRGDLPDIDPEKKAVLGWDREEVIKRAKSRLDAILEERHSN
jgi:hypothetical protein